MNVVAYVNSACSIQQGWSLYFIQSRFCMLQHIPRLSIMPLCIWPQN